MKTSHTNNTKTALSSSKTNKFAVYKSSNKTVVELTDKVACIPSFIGKACTVTMRLQKKFYHRSVKELRLEETERMMIFQ